MSEQDLKDTFASALFPMYKLLVISNWYMTLGEMMDVLFKKEACIKNLYAMHSNKSQTYDKKVNIPNTNKKPKVNNIDNNRKDHNKNTTERSNKPQRKFIELTDIADNILNVLLKE